ncbi:hypothetical protein EON63_13565 [archaeon]|nr:MAG: hypothetical protein EON63_13565 [archaeon]
MEKREQPGKRVYVIDGEELEEVPDDEEGLVVADIDENEDDGMDGDGEDLDGEEGYEVEETDEMMLAENEEEEVEDMSSYVFTGHTDAVYCVAIHPTDSTLIATGRLMMKCAQFIHHNRLSLSYFLSVFVLTTRWWR